MNSRKLFLNLILFVFLLNLTVFASDDGEETPLSLSNLFAPGYAVEDTNDDDLADHLNARIIIPEPELATAWHVAAAAEFAARLGFETTALSFPIVDTNSSDRIDIEIVIALLPEVRELLARELPGLIPLLKRNRGAIVLLAAQSGKGRRVLVVGADGQGLHNAAASFAGRWPNAWEIWGEKTSTRLNQLEKDLVAICENENVDPLETSVKALVYEFSPEQDKSPDTVSEEKKRNLENMLYRSGEVKAAFIYSAFSSAAQAGTAIEAIKKVDGLHHRGELVKILNYPGIAETYVVVHSPEKSQMVLVERFGHPARMLQRRPDPAAMRKEQEIKGSDFDLSDLYSLDGLFADTMKDQIPDRMETMIVLGPKVNQSEVADFAGRLSLESAGVSLPVSAVDLRVDQLRKIKQPILIGEGKATEWLVNQGKIDFPELLAGQGSVRIIPKAFNGTNAVVILGDESGIRNAVDYLAKIYPGILSSNPGDTSLAGVRKFAEGIVSGKSASGQFVAAISAISQELPVLERRSLAKVRINTFLDKNTSGFNEIVKNWLSSKLTVTDISVAFSGRRDPKTIVDEKMTWEYEVAEFKQLFSETFLPEVSGGSAVTLDVRLSEPKEVLEKLEMWIKQELSEKGAKPENASIRILCAYKQGFHWLRNEIMPKLETMNAKGLLIKFKPFEPDFKEIRKFYPERSRWLSELYPIDEIIARDLKMDLKNIVFEMDDTLTETYEAIAINDAGKNSALGSFTPKTTMREYLEQFPEWAKIETQTGWFSGKVNGASIIDQRIATDPERLWDSFQKVLLKKAYDHVMTVTGKKPTQQKQPFFHTLKVEAWLSEPDEKLGIDEELVSSTESLHEDIYFDSLDFFNGMVPREAEKLPEDARYLTRIGAPGSVIPLIHPARPGKAPEAQFTFLGNLASKNYVQIEWESPEGVKDSKKVDLKLSGFKDVKLCGILIDSSGIISCSISAATVSTNDIGHLSVGLPVLQKGVGNKDLNDIFRDGSAGKIHFLLDAKGARRELTLTTGRVELKDKETRTLPTGDLVDTGRIYNPREAANIAQMFSQFPGMRSYRSGTSYQGRDVYSIEIQPVTNESHSSRAKLITAKPTILVVGRQHANEVSSTTHLLRLAELLAKDEAFQEYRKKLNIILHPMENPDGAALMESLIELNPNHMNHASRYTSLGTDLGTQFRSPDTLLTEAMVRPKLWRRWLPDVFLNCHGYPSHEWVQQFSGYSPYQFRDYWIPRGWFVYLTHLDDPRSPDHRKAGEALLQYIDRFLKSDSKQLDTNSRIYNRYWRWSGRWQPHIVNYELHGDTMIYFDRRSDSPRKPNDRNKITALEGVPEAMDETPGREWMKTVVGQGLYYLEAHLRLLADAESKLDFMEEESGNRVHRSMFRRRPITLKTKTVRESEIMHDP